MPDVFAGLPCKDEDVAREAAGDYAVLAPKCERLAEGTDGAILASSWDLTSATNDFAAQGVQSGHVVVLESKVVGSKTVPMGKQVFGVAGTSGSACTLKRFGYATGIGRTPGAPSGISGVTFTVPSVLAHIAAEAVEVRRMLGLAANVDLSTLPDLRRVTALKALRSLYFAEYRQTTMDTWKDKMEILDAEIAALFKSLYDLFPTSDPGGLEPKVGSFIFEHEPECLPGRWSPYC